MSKNLWPNFEPTKTLRSPREVILESGSGLQDKTGGLLEFYPTDTRISGSEMQLAFSLYVARLHYHFPFMRASFPVDKFYPVRISAHEIEDEFLVKNEEELIASLVTIFNSATTVETIQKLMALAI